MEGASLRLRWEDVDLSAAFRGLVTAYRRNDLLTYAGAISFQILFALVPLLLLGLGLLGVFHLKDVWRQDLAPHVRDEVSRAAFALIDQTANQVLDRRQLLWVTFGAGFAVWQVSGAVRAVMGVFNRIYDVPERRPFWPRIAVSIALAAILTVLVLATVAIVDLGPGAARQVAGHGVAARVGGFVLRWGCAVALLLGVVALLVRFAPDTSRPWRWVSLGSLLVVGGWIAMSLVFAWYLGSVADYRSVFGSLATVIVLMEYLYIAAITFLTGIQIDALMREQVER